jgi:hypothetical protein
MEKTIYAECPFCRGMLEVNAESGKIVNKWKHEDIPKSADDRLKGALRKIEEDKKKRKDLFESTRDRLDEKKKDAQDAFQKEVERIKKEGKPIEPPQKQIDLY